MTLSLTFFMPSPSHFLLNDLHPFMIGWPLTFWFLFPPTGTFPQSSGAWQHSQSHDVDHLPMVSKIYSLNIQISTFFFQNDTILYPYGFLFPTMIYFEIFLWTPGYILSNNICLKKYLNHKKDEHKLRKKKHLIYLLIIIFLITERSIKSTFYSIQIGRQWYGVIRKFATMQQVC